MAMSQIACAVFMLCLVSTGKLHHYTIML